MKLIMSIIIVHYKVKTELFNCLDSIYKEKIKNKFEVIVVDNDERETIGKEIKEKFSKVRYIKSPKNIGFGAANNIGVKYAKGSLLFFLNPDTEVKPFCIDNLVSFINTDKNIGIVAPLLLDSKNIPFAMQGAQALTPSRAIFALSFINKYFPNNPVSKNYYLLRWNKKDIKEVDVVPGTAFLIRKKYLKKLVDLTKIFFFFLKNTIYVSEPKSLVMKYILCLKQELYIYGDQVRKILIIHKKYLIKAVFYILINITAY